MLRDLCVVLIAAAALSPCAPAHANPLFHDRGMYQVHVRDRALGTEAFSFDIQGDSILVFSTVHELLPRGGGVDTLDKRAAVAMDSLDYDLLGYESHALLDGQRLSRTLDLGDTALTAYMESERAGIGNRLVRPPGRLYVIDQQVFVLFDLILRTLHGSTLEERSVNVLSLGMRDTVLAVKVRRLGTETIRWGARPVQAQRFSIEDNSSAFLAWVSPAGMMLRLTEPNIGLRVEREPPPARRPRKPPGG